MERIVATILTNAHFLKFQTEKMKQTRAAQHPAKKKEHKERRELNAMVAEAVANAMKGCKTKKCKKSTESDKLEEENFNFPKLTKTSDDEASAMPTTSNRVNRVKSKMYGPRNRFTE
jgi:hypothetical protein